MPNLDCTLSALIRAGFPPLAVPSESPPIAPADWAPLVEHARQERLAALFYVALKNSARLNELPRELGEALRLLYLRAHLANWQAIQVLQDLLAQFEHAQIPVILLKGAALSVTLYYAEPALRQLGDLDLLIRAQDKARAARLLQTSGFEPYLDLTAGFREDFGSEQLYTRRGKRAASIDLHWNIVNRPAYARHIVTEWFWARTLQVPLGDRSALVLNWDAQLLHLIEHFVIHHRMRGVRWSLDIALVLAAHQNELQWEQVIEAAQNFGVLPALRAALANVDAMWGIAAPAPIRAQLAQVPRGLGDQLAVITATAEQTDAMVLREGMSYSTWRRRASYFFHVFFPSPAYMRARYRITRSALLPFFYLVRLGLGARRFIASVSSMGINALTLWRKHRAAGQRADTRR